METDMFSVFCNICYINNGHIVNICKRQPSLQETLISLVGHRDIINNSSIYLCKSCIDTVTGIQNFKKMCLRNLIRVRQLYNEIDKIELDVDSSAADMLRDVLNYKVIQFQKIELPEVKEEVFDGNGDTSKIAVLEENNDKEAADNFDDSTDSEQAETSEKDSATCISLPELKGLKSSDEVCESVKNETGTSKFNGTWSLGCSKKPLNPSDVPKLGKLRLQCMFQNCGKIFSNHEEVNIHHILTHADPTPYRCYWRGCGMKFARLKKMKKHFRRHTADKPFKCEKCECVFTDSYDVFLHLRDHDAEVPP